MSPLPQQENTSSLSPLMTIKEKTNPMDARIYNRMMIFNLLFPSGSLSRAQIGRSTHLSRVSVSEVVSDLIDKHTLRETGQENPSHRGKKGTLVSVDTSYWNIISIDLSQPFIIQGAVTNLLGQVVERAEQPVERSFDITPDMVVELCMRLIGKVSGAILGIGIAVPGIVDNYGTVLDSRILDWSNVELSNLIGQRFHTPCVVDNDANSALLTERFFGERNSDTIFIQIAVGIGSAILIDDSMVLGTNHTAGEIGHVVVDPEGPECTCGKRGCLETLVSAPSLRLRISENPETKKDILEDAGRHLGKALAMSVSLLDVTDIAVYGPADIVNGTFLNSAAQAIHSFTASRLQEKTATVRRCECGGNLIIRGESISVLQSMLRQLS